MSGSTQSDHGRGRRESPASRFVSDGKQSLAQLRTALKPVLEHPFWAAFPKAIFNSIDLLESLHDDRVLAERVSNALQLIAEHGSFGEAEEAFVTAARAEFVDNESFVHTAVNFIQTLLGEVGSKETEADKNASKHADLVRFIFLAARHKPELLELLNDSVYKDLDPSVVNNPHLDALLEELVVEKCIKTQKDKQAIKAMLSPLHANWTLERCQAASRLLGSVVYFRGQDLASLRLYVAKFRSDFPKVVQKILPIALALRVTHSEEKVLRYEAVCFAMHKARQSHHA